MLRITPDEDRTRLDRLKTVAVLRKDDSHEATEMDGRAEGNCEGEATVALFDRPDRSLLGSLEVLGSAKRRVQCRTG